MNLGSLIDRHARYRPDHIATVCDGEALTWRAFDDRVNRMANALLGAGLGPGDRVAAILPNLPELLWLYWAAAKTGAVVVPLSPLLRERGLASLLADAGPGIVITDAGHAAEVLAVRDRVPTVPPAGWLLAGPGEAAGFHPLGPLLDGASGDRPDVATPGADALFNIIYSSGTTGEPKGIMHTHRVRAAYAALFATACRMTPESISLHTGSLVFNGAFITMMPSFMLGATWILHREFTPAAVIATVREARVSHMVMVPAQIAALLDNPGCDAENLGSLEMVLSVGAALPLEHKERLQAVLPGRLYEVYGCTEGLLTILDPADFARKTGSVGAPPPFHEIRVVDPEGRDLAPGEVGEIVGRGTITAPGYWRRPDLTAATVRDGWVWSGDLGYMDGDGFLWLVDRSKDMIVSGGVNVYPRDIEEVVAGHPAVREVAVFGLPHPKWGETPVAAVIPREAEEIREDDLRDWINDRVGARFQRVSRVIVLDDFPRNIAGKTLKRLLRERYAAD